MVQQFDFPITTTDQSVDRVLAADLPALLVFLNGGTVPALDEVLNRLAKDNVGQLLVVKVRVKDSPATARRYGITTPPALATVRGGQTQTKAEAISPAELDRHAAYLLGKGPRPEAAASGAAPGPSVRPAGGGADGHPRVVTDATFDQDVMRSPQPVLVDFWAPWCGPCRMVESVVEKLAGEYAGRMRVAKVNVDENPGVAGRYGIQSIPTMLVVRDGRIVDRWAGALPEPLLRKRVAQWVKG